MLLVGEWRLLPLVVKMDTILFSLTVRLRRVSAFLTPISRERSMLTNLCLAASCTYSTMLESSSLGKYWLHLHLFWVMVLIVYCPYVFAASVGMA